MEAKTTPSTLSLVPTESLIEELVARNQAVIIGIAKFMDSVEEPILYRTQILGNDLMLAGLIRLLNDNVDKALAQKYEKEKGDA